MPGADLRASHQGGKETRRRCPCFTRRGHGAMYVYSWSPVLENVRFIQVVILEPWWWIVLRIEKPDALPQLGGVQTLVSRDKTGMYGGFQATERTWRCMSSLNQKGNSTCPGITTSLALITASSSVTICTTGRRPRRSDSIKAVTLATTTCE